MNLTLEYHPQLQPMWATKKKLWNPHAEKSWKKKFSRLLKTKCVSRRRWARQLARTSVLMDVTQQILYFPLPLVLSSFFFFAVPGRESAPIFSDVFVYLYTSSVESFCRVVESPRLLFVYMYIYKNLWRRRARPCMDLHSWWYQRRRDLVTAISNSARNVECVRGNLSLDQAGVWAYSLLGLSTILSVISFHLFIHTYL